MYTDKCFCDSKCNYCAKATEMIQIKIPDRHTIHHMSRERARLTYLFEPLSDVLDVMLDTIPKSFSSDAWKLSMEA